MIVESIKSMHGLPTFLEFVISKWGGYNSYVAGEIEFPTKHVHSLARWRVVRSQPDEITTLPRNVSFEMHVIIKITIPNGIFFSLEKVSNWRTDTTTTDVNWTAITTTPTQ